MAGDLEILAANHDTPALAQAGVGSDFAEIAPPPSRTMLSPAQVQSGPPIEPLTRIVTYDPSQWETFIDEWVSISKRNITRSCATPAPMIEASTSRVSRIRAICKASGTITSASTTAMPSAPGTAWPEIGKMLWHSFRGEFAPPHAYYFVAPRGTGTTLTQYLTNAPALKAALIEAWSKVVADTIHGNAARKTRRQVRRICRRL